MAGYSGTPLPQKLGVKAGSRLVLVNAPAEAAAWLTPLPPGVRPRRARVPDPAGSVDVLLLFCLQRDMLARQLQSWLPALTAAGGLWVAWPKRSSGVKTDLDEAAVRTAGLATGLVDNKVCAISEVWSGLRFVTRLKDRG
ncbi:MAG TPA: DUF3052 domain-containing protein [bacterium]|nr:DUF3052 domain-containing protein [bacterium]